MAEDENACECETPYECNVLGIKFRWVCMAIAIILFVKNFCLVTTYSERHQISCNLWSFGIDSYLFQYGDDVWASIGLLIASFCLFTNVSLFIGALYLIPTPVLCWYVGGLSQFIYLICFQIFCLSSGSCQRCEYKDKHEHSYVKRHYKLRFGLCLFITWYFYSTFIFKIQLFYSYLKYKNTQLNRPLENEQI